MKDMDIIVAEMTHADRLLAICDFEAYSTTNLVKPNSTLLAVLMDYRMQHPLLQSVPLANQLREMGLELYKFYAKEYRQRIS